jgi:hypothetical protein
MVRAKVASRTRTGSDGVGVGSARATRRSMSVTTGTRVSRGWSLGVPARHTSGRRRRGIRGQCRCGCLRRAGREVASGETRPTTDLARGVRGRPAGCRGRRIRRDLCRPRRGRCLRPGCGGALGRPPWQPQRPGSEIPANRVRLGCGSRHINMIVSGDQVPDTLAHVDIRTVTRAWRQFLRREARTSQHCVTPPTMTQGETRDRRHDRVGRAGA